MRDPRPIRKPRTPSADEVADAPWLYDGRQIVAALLDMRRQRDAAMAPPGIRERIRMAAEALRRETEASR